MAVPGAGLCKSQGVSAEASRVTGSPRDGFTRKASRVTGSARDGFARTGLANGFERNDFARTGFAKHAGPRQAASRETVPIQAGQRQAGCNTLDREGLGRISGARRADVNSDTDSESRND